MLTLSNAGYSQIFLQNLLNKNYGWIQGDTATKMIAMMYLVLTALLALNVSVEIIEAFVIVNRSIGEPMKTSNPGTAKPMQGLNNRIC